MQDNIQIKDVYDISPPEDTQLADAKVVDTPVLKKLQAFEAALKGANMVSTSYYVYASCCWKSTCQYAVI